MKTYQLLYHKLLVVNALLLLTVSKSPAQNRISDSQTIGWYTYNGDHKLNDRWAIHTEYQWRRTEKYGSLELSHRFRLEIAVAG